MKPSQLFDTAGVLPTVEVMARSDVQLMLAVKEGDELSFELLLRRYRTPLVNFLNRMVRDTGLAEDLAQEVFMRVYRARKDYEPNAKFTTWLFRIATNLALNALRDGRHRMMEVSIDQKIGRWRTRASAPRCSGQNSKHRKPFAGTRSRIGNS